ncbi:hypothetical protein P171DRAFT_488196 [Karstenula rhodostoma CBS 690.94]|uniref:Uncharacterized protein n=1 Tax=Karstenula rhodostoma CBS 690.94 TaxID=1392251 RepID=A0A9P4U7Z1_9PLEO|nr:hypothetical protein P171DRAFT_488196 [Karstenula rhodostoma CBS 690.94]
MEANVPRKRGRPKKYHTEEQRKEASRIAVRKSLQKKREQERTAADAPQVGTHSNPQHISPSVTSKHFQPARSGIGGLQNKLAIDFARFTPQPPLRPKHGSIPSQFIEPANFLGPSPACNAHGLAHAPSPVLQPDASGSWRMGQDLREVVHPHNTGLMSTPGKYYRAVTPYDTVPQKLPTLASKVPPSKPRSDALGATAKATNAQESHENNVAGSDRHIGGSKGRSDRKTPQLDSEARAEERDQITSDAIRAREHVEEEAAARRREEKACQERLRRAALPELRALKRTLDKSQAIAEQPQDDFDRHIRFISEWLQAESYDKPHTFPTDGQAIYAKKIKPRIHQIQRSALSQNATFAIQYVGLMALTHVLRLIYVHRGSRVGGEIWRFYDADARLNYVDELTAAMLAIYDKIDDNNKEWLKTQQGAADVLLQEMLEVWPMISAAGPIQVQHNLGCVLWTTFRHKAVPGF